MPPAGRGPPPRAAVCTLALPGPPNKEPIAANGMTGCHPGAHPTEFWTISGPTGQDLKGRCQADHSHWRVSEPGTNFGRTRPEEQQVGGFLMTSAASRPAVLPGSPRRLAMVPRSASVPPGHLGGPGGRRLAPLEPAPASGHRVSALAGVTKSGLRLLCARRLPSGETGCPGAVPSASS